MYNKYNKMPIDSLYVFKTHLSLANIMCNYEPKQTANKQ